MLTNARLAAVIPVSDIEASTRFYEEKLGLKLIDRRDDIPENPEAHFEVGGTGLLLYKSVGAGQSRHTLAGFEVDDIEETVAALRDNGVTFEEYDMPGLKTQDGIATMGDSKGAWFKDPDGNILAVEARVPAAKTA
jgi:catechol 2,3-dioxygenase-like lactoylglutathione lyase family enzyme